MENPDRVGQRSLLQPPPSKKSRDELAQKEEADDIINFQIVYNDGDPTRLMLLLQLKSLFSTQLPEMPRKYILRLVFDRQHRSLALCKDGLVVGGVCFRPQHEMKFAEIVFCAISSSQQVKGYGTRIMNTLKEHVKTEGIRYFLTYADNHAIGYFKKQGFSKTITMSPDRYMGYIKHYNKSTLMECDLMYRVNYRDVAGLLRRQRQQVYLQMDKASSFNRRYKGLTLENVPDANKLTTPTTTTTTAFVAPVAKTAIVPVSRDSPASVVEISNIPGIVEAGYVKPDAQFSAASRKERHSIRKMFITVVKYLKKQDEAWPFMEPVNAEEVPDYYSFITYPMDLKTMGSKAERGEYKDVAAFVIDFYRLVDNSRGYNKPETQYYICADKLEANFKLFMRTIKLDPSRPPEIPKPVRIDPETNQVEDHNNII
jgi:histone acetyltransferase